MRHPQHILFSDDISSDDEIDNLFNQLQQIEPPSSLVERILTSVLQLPQPQVTPILLWDGVLVVRNNNREPS